MIQIRAVRIETTLVTSFRNLGAVFYLLNYKGLRRRLNSKVNQLIVFSQRAQSYCCCGTVNNISALCLPVAFSMGACRVNSAFIEGIWLEEIQRFCILHNLLFIQLIPDKNQRRNQILLDSNFPGPPVVCLALGHKAFSTQIIQNFYHILQQRLVLI